MKDETQINPGDTSETQIQGGGGEDAAPKKGGMKKKLMLGGGLLVVVAGLAFGAMQFMGGGDASETPSETAEAADTSAAAHTDVEEEPVAAEDVKVDHAEEPEFHDNMFGFDPSTMDLSDEELAGIGMEDATVLDKIEDNLNFLDYDPETESSDSEESFVSEEDSIAKVNWIKSETERLTTWEGELTSLKKELDRQEAKLNQYVLRLEQAESSRIMQLARLYDGMDSRAVAALMGNLDDETVVAILPRMKPKSASQVLQMLPSQRAAKLSKQMITVAEQ